MKTYSEYCLYLFFCVCAWSCKQKETWVQPTEGPITEALFASGHIEPVDEYLLTSVNEGYLKERLVTESDLVSPGETLFVLDYETKVIEQQAAKKNWQIARQNASPESPVLNKLRNDLDAAQQKCLRDSIQYVRLKLLYATQSVSQLEVENMQLQYEVDISNIKAIRANLAATELSLQQALIQAESQYNSFETGNEYYKIKSAQTARVYQIFKKPGELVRKGEAVALLGNPDTLKVMLLMDETSITKVKTGQTVLVELNTHKGKIYEASVLRIYPYFDNATQSFKVEAIFTEPITSIIAGTLLQANIIVAKKNNALLIPRACLSPDGKVTVKREKVKEIITPQTGIIATEWVEVISGIKPSDKILQSF
ncbi:MAG: HlyD family efflux transporter periplasmic adaptor subunit [Cyclobacteriaceae bacterium]|nr:HlyD family efflux transporter periplasmic adaptor subunit [Cyclobacteriaceae bacterium]